MMISYSHYISTSPVKCKSFTTSSMQQHFLLNPFIQANIEVCIWYYLINYEMSRHLLRQWWGWPGGWSIVLLKGNRWHPDYWLILPGYCRNKCQGVGLPFIFFWLRDVKSSEVTSTLIVTTGDCFWYCSIAYFNISSHHMVN